MRTLALLALVAVFLSVSAGRHYTPGDYLEYAPSDGFGHSRSNPNSVSEPFQQKNTEYTFIYNAQIASGLQSEENVANPQQKAITRVQCLAKIQFASNRLAQLQLQQCRAGQQNEQMSEPQEMQPIEAFEQANIPSQAKLQLQQPCQFSYSDGVVERVQCQQDEDWSKNFKKAVLNMIQLNLKRNSPQKDPKQQNTEQYAWETKMGKTFTTTEITLEGECQTTYTINKARAGHQYSVTKTINFKKCQKIADVAKGFQTDQPQAQCAHCQQYWAQQQDEQNLQQVANAPQQQQQNGEQHPCANCDPKEVKENELDRSTVIRCRIQGEPNEQYALNGCELQSQYMYRNSKNADGNYGAAMQTVVTATLQALDVQLKQQQIPAISASDEETLLYSNGKDVDEKRFYKNGDKDFGTNGKDSPFARVPKVQQAVQALNKLVQNMQDRQKGIDQQAPIQQQRLVEMLRMCTQQELKQVEQQCPGTTAQQRQQCKQVVVIALAQCGTMNCVAELAKRIKNKQVPKAVVVQALLSLNQLPAPSDGILDQMEQLCKSEAVNSQPMPKQSCWLTFGALVNEVCQHKTEKNAQECVGSTANCVQSGFYEKDQCPTEKKQKYKEAMLAVYQNHGCIFDKAVALGALGNAGLHNALNDLEKIMKNSQEPRVVRVMAIDATRRLGVEMPRKVRNVLLPVFLNTREQPQLRTAAFANLLNAQTEPQVVDQLMFAIAKEPNKEVQSYAYRTMKTLAKSQNPNERRIAKHIKSVLKMANVDEQQLRYSGKWQFSLYNAKEREGAFISLAQAVSSRSALPAYAHAQLDSHFNDQYQLNNVKVFMLQQEAEKWYGNLADRFITQQQQQTRAQRQNLQYSTKLRNIHENLGIKNRRSLSYDNEMDGSMKIGTYKQQNIQPFVMLCLRSNNVDKAFLALDEHIMEEQTRKMLNGQEKANWALLFGQGQQLNTAILQNLNEKEAKIPTSAGVPLRILNSMPVLANIEGQLKIKTESARLTSPLGLQLDINAKASARMAQIQKMELWTPFAASGVECVRSVQVNLPLQGELNANSDQGISLKAKLPQQKTQLANAHSLPITYIAKVDPKTNLVREPRQILTIHDPKLERQQHEVNAVQGQKNWAMPLHIQGHYHWPTEPTSYQQFAQLLLATENAVQVHYQPGQNSPREAILRITGEHFQKAAQNEQPGTQLRNFFAEEFTSPYSCNVEQCQQDGDCEQCSKFEQQQKEDAQEVEGQQVRQQQLHSFINAYKPRQQYKNSLKLVAQTNGGAKDAKAQCDIQTQCDEQMNYCKVQVQAERPPIGSENEKWTFNAQAHVLMPETAASVEQLQRKPQQFKQFIAQAKAQWGQQGQSQQHVNVRMLGTQAHTQHVRAALQQRQDKRLISAQQQRNFQRRSAFLNKLQIEAAYSLKAYAQNAINRVLEVLKSTYFWNTKSQLLSGQNAQKNGKMAAIIVIDSMTQKNANVTIRTPAQKVLMQQIELPSKVRPFSLIRHQSAQQIDSLVQLFHHFSIKNRPQCTVDGRSVDTFDDFIYTAPLSSNCHSVLAKDCGSEEPQFVVLMKKVPQQQNNNNKSASTAEKMLVVITPKQQIECQPKTNTKGPQQRRLICKVNGQQVAGDEQCQGTSCVQFNEPQQSDVTIRTEDIAVRFNGRKAWLKVSRAFKNTQCGLCGHYDDSDDQEEELRMANGKFASNLAEFHRSYALKDSELCSQQALDNFYSEQNGKQDSFLEQYNQLDNDSEQNNEAEGEALESDWQKEQFDGKLDSSEEHDEEDIGNNLSDNISEPDGPSQPPPAPKCCCCCQEGEDEQCQQKCHTSKQCDVVCKGGRCAAEQPIWKATWPTWKTKIQEQNHAVCFSTQPVKQCPSGAYSYSSVSSDYGSDEEEDSNDDEQQNEQKSKRVSFVCMERADPETRRLLRLLRQGQRVVNVSGHGASFTETVNEPQQCWHSRF
uniref:Vitellogenin n=1 Tax=Globodera rostochiensis TaxID=31243 RepID=A0A914HBT3_GLORO